VGFVLELEAVAKRYRQGEAVVEVLSGANLSVAAGEVVALTAPSGAGKTTLLQIAGLLDSPDAGRVSLAGKDAAGLDDRTRSRLRSAELGFVFQFHHLLPEFTAAENVVLPQIISGVRRLDAQARAAELLGMMGLEERATHRPAALSGGEQQRVALARALANAPSLILADEPTGNLDAATALAVTERLLELAHQTGIAMLVATHNPTLAKLMDRQVTLIAGEIIEV
jgi:lipoprotein-releasing system ATP-binding protein